MCRNPDDRALAPYGSWESPISAALVAETSVRFSEVRVDGEDVYWHERRPGERGRGVVVRRVSTGESADAVPEAFDVRTRVHEYGGGSYEVRGGTLVFANDADQRLYRTRGGDIPVPITPAPRIARGLRYADLTWLRCGRRLVCVRESHEGSPGDHPVNALVLVELEGDAEPRVVHAGRDFYAFPRVSGDGTRIAWICWDHPDMPWSSSELWVAALGADGSIDDARLLAGGESLFQPEWSPEDVLHVVSDRSGFWNLHRLGERGALEPVAPMEAEMAHPMWVFALATYAFLPGGRICCAIQSGGEWQLALITPPSRTIDPVCLPYTDVGHGPRIVADRRGRVLLVGAGPTRAPEVARIRLDVDAARGGAETRIEVLSAAPAFPLDPAYVPHARPITFPTSEGAHAHAFFYPPRNAGYRAPREERPPLIVMGHGGPTASTSTALSIELAYWTTRGFAVCDVNYRGSSGYGREYRRALDGRWGVADVEDLVAAARFLVAEDGVDPERLAVRGGSAAGFAALSALVFHDAFTAGSSRYGVADLEALVQETHKFESHYTDALVGPYPEAKALYRERSPVHHADRITCPVLILQGLDDRVVPPSQSERLVRALDSNHVPHAYVTFEGEGHGWRTAETAMRALETELAFFALVFGFEPADDLPPLRVENL